MAEAAVEGAQAEPLVVPLPVLRRSQLEERLRLDQGVGGDLLVLQGTGACHQLVRRSGRVVVLDGVVRERLGGVVDELLERRGRDSAGEQVVVVCRQADHREDLSVLRVLDDEHAALQAGSLHAAHERVLRLLLDGRVDRER